MSINYTVSRFMKTVLNISSPITLISPWFSPNFKAASIHVNGQKIEKGRQWKEDKRVKSNKIHSKHVSHWSIGVIVDLIKFGSDLPFLYERIGGSLNDSLSTQVDSVFIRCHFAIRIFLRLSTEGRYSVTNSKILLCVFSLFCSPDDLSLNLTSERIFFERSSG